MLPAFQVSAATFSANSNATLVSAINSANGNSESDTINITGNFTLTNNTPPQIFSAITINGNDFTINGQRPATRPFVIRSGGNLTLNNITLTDFFNSSSGGAIRVDAGSLTLHQVTVRDSRSNSSGGGIYASGSASVTINRSAIHGNRATNSNGGGLFFATGVTATINNSSIFNNQALRAGGILVNSTSATLSLNHVTITGNTATATSGDTEGGILVNEGTLNLRSSIIYGNSNQNCQIGSSGVVSVNSDNIIGGGSSANCSSNQSSADPLLSASPTGSPPYYTFREDSPARNAATCISGITTDQRGATRPQGSSCDIGAYEGPGHAAPPQVNNPPPRQRQETSGSPASVGDSGAIYIPPAEIKATATPGISTCLTLPGIVTYNITESTQCQRLDAVGIGNAEIAVSGFADAVNVWSWVLPGTKICFEAEGSAFKFIDTEPIPRVVYDLPATNENGLTCGIIDRPGNLILLPGARPPAAPTPTLEALSLQNCMARTTNILNFRASPGGAVIQAIPYNAILTAVARTADWFKVDFHGVKGWISADFVEPIGTCG